MTQEEIRLRCVRVGAGVRGGDGAQQSAIADVARWVGDDELKLQCVEAARIQGVTSVGLIARAGSIHEFCKKGPAEPEKPTPKVAKKKTFSRGGRRSR